METVPALVLPLWAGAMVALIVSLAVIMSTKPQPEPRGARAFLLPFAIPLALASAIALTVTAVGSLLLTARGILDAGGHYEPGELTPGAGAAIAIALVLSLAVLLVCAVLASRPGDGAHPH